MPTVDLGVDLYECRSRRDDVESVRELIDRNDRNDDENLLWRDLDHVVGVLHPISSLAS